MFVTVEDIAEQLHTTPILISSLLKKIGYRRRRGFWRINEEMAAKLIKAVSLWRATKPKDRKYLNLKALKQEREYVVHNKPTIAFIPAESNKYYKKID